MVIIKASIFRIIEEFIDDLRYESTFLKLLNKWSAEVLIQENTKTFLKQENVWILVNYHRTQI